MGLSSRFDLEVLGLRATSAKRSSSCPLERREEPKAPEPAAPLVVTKPEREGDKLTAVPEEPSTFVAEYALERMRKHSSGEDGAPRTWLRVVHSGYGSQAWAEALKDSVHTHVTTARHQEGIYVLLRKGAAVEDLVDDLMAMNLEVRKMTQFKEMKRSNKSRLQFKASVTVFPTAKAQAEHDKLVPVADDESDQASDETEPVGTLSHSVISVPKSAFHGFRAHLDRSLTAGAQPHFLQSYLGPQKGQKGLARGLSTCSTASSVGTPASWGGDWTVGASFEGCVADPRGNYAVPMQQMGMQMQMPQQPMQQMQMPQAMQVVYVQVPVGQMMQDGQVPAGQMVQMVPDVQVPMGQMMQAVPAH
jgi:hypothetical protein